MNTLQRSGKPKAKAWLLATLCVCSQISHAADVDNVPPVSDGPFVSNVAGTASGNVIEQSADDSVVDSWKPRVNKHHVGLSIGKARFNMPCIEGMVCRRNGRAITLHAGGDFSKRLGFELAYMRMSNLAHQGNAIRVRGVNLNLLGELPLASRLTLSGRLGTNYAWTRMDIAGKAHGFGLSYGVGLNWDISDRWSAATDLNRHDFKFVTGRDSVDTATLSLRYRY
ncbi:porin family protein [Aquabacterium sp.]|uniref:porin family protein n=1 Tax=Aquabacterium sp. TaxID=1872578 RepID=UPI003D6C8E24